MGQILQFPSMKNREEVSRANNKAQQEYLQKINRINALNYSQINDTNMLKQIKGSWEELGKNRNGVERRRNEDEFIDCYLSYIQEEKKNRKGDGSEVIEELDKLIQEIFSLRRKFRSVDGLIELESLKIGELKRKFRSLLVYYIKVKENLIEIEDNIRRTWMAA